MRIQLKWMLLASLVLMGCSDDSSKDTDSGGEPIDPKPQEEDGCKDCDTTHSVCFNKVCYDQRTCANPCPDDEICMAGACMFCRKDGQCFATGSEKVSTNDETVKCESVDDCASGFDCVEGECRHINTTGCDPECESNQVCYQGECRPKSFLWSLCRASSECGTGSSCIFEIQPSTVLDFNGTTYGTSDNPNIPVSLLDSRINVAHYNESHPNSQANEGQRIGICSTPCTNPSDNCPAGWTCMLALTGDPVYPADATLPFAKDLDQSRLEKSGYVNLCRPVITENTASYYPYNKALCGSNESACKEANGVFYDGMCLEPCNTNNYNSCPFMFSCREVNIANDTQSLCVPNNGTCGKCLDRDGDGVGYGLCPVDGIDCNDDDKEAWYGKKLGNDTSSCQLYASEVTDLNCNGLIDRFEMIGTTDNCAACGVKCPTPGSEDGKTVVECVTADGSEISPDWRNYADAETKASAFMCRTSCAFGFGDCNKNAKCNTPLLSEEAKSVDEKGNVIVSLNPKYFDISGNTGHVLVNDADGDGFAALDVGMSATNGSVMLSTQNTVVCCASASDVCYTADASWSTTTRPTTYIEFSQKNDLEDIMKYDAKDTNNRINPDAADICDGIDNDGSTVLLTSQDGKFESCREYCEKHQEECAAFDKGEGKYNFNNVCDASPDGVKNPTPFEDVWNKLYKQGEECSIYNKNKDVCNPHGKVLCDPYSRLIPHICSTEDPKCKCFKGCPCEDDPTKVCDGSADSPCKADHEPDDSTYVVCQPKIYGLICSAAADGSDNTFNNVDDDCNGLVDDAAVKPCIITLPNDTDLKFGDGASCTATGDDTTDPDAAECGYVVPPTESDYNTALASAKALNRDGSLNLCRLGKLEIDINKQKPSTVENPEKDPEYYAKCVPMFSPRQYDRKRAEGSKNSDVDFFGDGIDSNCDGYDYDLRNAVFVDMSGEGNCNGSNAHIGRYLPDASCGLRDEPGISPIASLDKAISVAKNVVPNSEQLFFDDILVRNVTSTSGSSSAINPADRLLGTANTADANQPQDFKSGTLVIPSTSNVYNPPSRLSVPEESNTPYAFHKYFVDNRTLDATNYRYPNETIEPEALVRIIGGLTHMHTDNVEDKDLDYTTWKYGNSITNTEARRIIDVIDNTVYHIIKNENSSYMSLALHHIDFKLTSADAVYKFNEANINRDLLNGVTFIGLDCGSMGCEKLVFDHTSITVTAPPGYSFTGAPVSNYGAASYSQNWWNYGYKGYRNEGSNYKSTYSSWYSKSDCNTGFSCRNNSVTGSGGCGGWGEYSGSGCQIRKELISDANISGKAGGWAEQAGGAGAWNNDTSSSHGDCPNTNPVGDDYRGGAGALGKQGAPGKYSKSQQPALERKNGILRFTFDTTPGDGKYGTPGSGGGGGAVYRFYYYCSAGGWYHAGCGGPGGCGGAGGYAGGTGGSAIGVILKSPQAQDKTLKLEFDRKSLVEVTVGKGGVGQVGEAGQDGMAGGDGVSYGRKTAGSCVQYQKAGKGGDGGAGGGGGPGAGGYSGTGYSFLFSCARNFTAMKIDNKDYTADGVRDIFVGDDVNSVAAAIKSGVCGFEVPDHFGDDLTGVSTAKCHGAAGIGSATATPTYSKDPIGLVTDDAYGQPCRFFKGFHEQ